MLQSGQEPHVQGASLARSLPLMVRVAVRGLVVLL